MTSLDKIKKTIERLEKGEIPGDKPEDWAFTKMCQDQNKIIAKYQYPIKGGGSSGVRGQKQGQKSGANDQKVQAKKPRNSERDKRPAVLPETISEKERALKEVEERKAAIKKSKGEAEPVRVKDFAGKPGFLIGYQRRYPKNDQTN